MRTRRNRQVNEWKQVNREKDKIWNQIGLSKKVKLIKGKKTILAAQVIVKNGEKKQT